MKPAQTQPQVCAAVPVQGVGVLLDQLASGSHSASGAAGVKWCEKHSLRQFLTW